MTTWFTSDLHFFHRNITKYTDRNLVTTAEQHDEWLFDLWNSQVKPGDFVYHIGDFAFSKGYDQLARVVSRLNGQKFFIKGNHDNEDHLDRLLEDHLIVKWKHYKEIKIGETPTVLFHFPISSWHRQSHGSWHLHGHCHSNLKEMHTNGKMLDVGIDNAYKLTGKHQFFTEQMITEYMQGREMHVADEHRQQSGR